MKKLQKIHPENKLTPKPKDQFENWVAEKNYKNPVTKFANIHNTTSDKKIPIPAKNTTSNGNKNVTLTGKINITSPKKQIMSEPKNPTEYDNRFFSLDASGIHIKNPLSGEPMKNPLSGFLSSVRGDDNEGKNAISGRVCVDKKLLQDGVLSELLNSGNDDNLDKSSKVIQQDSSLGEGRDGEDMYCFWIF